VQGGAFLYRWAGYGDVLQGTRVEEVPPLFETLAILSKEALADMMTSATRVTSNLFEVVFEGKWEQKEGPHLVEGGLFDGICHQSAL